MEIQQKDSEIDYVLCNIQYQGGGTGGAGAISPPSFWDLFSKFWEFFENPLFAIYYSPPIKNLLPPTLYLLLQHEREILDFYSRSIIVYHSRSFLFLETPYSVYTIQYSKNQKK